MLNSICVSVTVAFNHHQRCLNNIYEPEHKTVSKDGKKMFPLKFSISQLYT